MLIVWLNSPLCVWGKGFREADAEDRLRPTVRVQSTYSLTPQKIKAGLLIYRFGELLKKRGGGENTKAKQLKQVHDNQNSIHDINIINSANPSNILTRWLAMKITERQQKNIKASAKMIFQFILLAKSVTDLREKFRNASFRGKSNAVVFLDKIIMLYELQLR
mgnify:CR=1 FL=1